MTTIHTNLDLITGNCLDCGATREAIDDNLYPTCEKATGPHRLAIMLIRREALHRENWAGHARHHVAEAEEAAVYWEGEARKADAAGRELRATIDYLKGDEPKPLPLAEAVTRLRSR
jgi:hypothetical protein